MRYSLYGFTSDVPQTVAIDKSVFDRVETAMESLLRILGIEEKFDMLAENYDELEGELDSIARRDVLFGRIIGAYSAAHIHIINRRMINFLATARLYLDHVDHDLKVVLGSESPARAAFTAARQTHYDDVFGFAVLEALRNYSQHRDIPVHGLVHSSALKRETPTRQILHTVRISLDVKRLEREGGFKKDVLAKLVAIGDTVELKPLLREYATSLRRIHAIVRQQLQQPETTWTQVIADTVDLFRTLAKSPDATLYYAESFADTGEIMSQRSVFTEFLQRLKELRIKNSRTADLTTQLRAAD